MSARRPAIVSEVTSPASAAGADKALENSRRLWRIAVIMLALVAAGQVLLSTAKYGAGLSSDSVAYYDIARSLMSGKGYVFHSGEPLVCWPPLYPTLLALVGSATGLDPGAFAHIVNAVLFAFVICLSACLFWPAFRQDPAYGLLGVLAVLLSLPLSVVYAMAWSECLFIVLVLFYLVHAQRYWKSGSMWSLTLMLLSTALACLTRYIGVTLVLAGALTVMLASGLYLRVRLARTFAFVVVSLLPLGLWLVHNYQKAGTLSGNRFHPGFDLVPNAILAAMTILLWYEPVGMVAKLAPASVARAISPAGWSLTLTASLCVGLAGAIVLALALVLSRALRRRLACSLWSVFSECSPTVLYLAAYLVALLALASRGASSYVDHRLLSPVYVPVTQTLFMLIWSLTGQPSPAGAAIGRRVPMLLFVLWLCLPLQRVVASTAERFRNGAGGYSTSTWYKSETLAAARRLSEGSTIHAYSNGADALWALAGVSATMTPSRLEVRLEDLKGHWPAREASILVWFTIVTKRPYLFSIEELGSISSIERLAHFSDGFVYRVSVRDTTPAARN
ncbi:hypothetical protein JXD38_03915 [candidate division WOR-3 bacterium]|nr:hypothetical protein [candidate division WOR-3 bacterium]